MAVIYIFPEKFLVRLKYMKLIVEYNFKQAYILDKMKNGLKSRKNSTICSLFSTPPGFPKASHYLPYTCNMTRGVRTKSLCSTSTTKNRLLWLKPNARQIDSHEDHDWASTNICKAWYNITILVETKVSSGTKVSKSGRWQHSFHFQKRFFAYNRGPNSIF